MNASFQKNLYYLMTTSSRLFEENVYFGSPFGVIFSIELAGQIVF